MQVHNVHSREYPVAAAELGRLLDTLASEHDQLWPHRIWPRMRLDRGLAVGARGGHGPIRYDVEQYRPGAHVVFRFTGPKGFDGVHGYDVIELGPARCELRQTLTMRAHGLARLAWPLVYRPLHDALIEDSLSRAEGFVQRSVPAASSTRREPTVRRWSAWVRLLRTLLSGGRAAAQHIEVPE